MLWIQRHQPELYARAHQFLQAKDYAAYKLSGVFATDYSDASGTNLFDLERRDWAVDMIEAVELDPRKLPPVHPSSTVIGQVTPQVAAETGLLVGTPVVIGGGDGACATVGAGSVHPGDAYNYIGSSSWIAVTAEQPLYDPQMRTFTFAHLDPKLYFPTGAMQCAGGSFDWLERLLRCPEPRRRVVEGLRFSANINTFNACADRYVLSGYGERLTTEELIKAATQVEGLTGVEVVGLWHVNDDNLEQMHRQIKDAGLEVTCVTPDIWASRKWGWGSFSSNDAQIRRDAIHEVKKSMEWAKQLNCEIVDLWFGQDGYDYPLQADYLAAWDRIIEGTIECAEHVPEVKLVIEYKPKEPRTHCFIATAGKTLLLVEKVDEPNVGAMIDVGHALMAYESAAESAAMLQYFGQKLFYMHFNDNWRLWDDDMTVGSIHIVEMLELLYWLDRMDYNGWYALDIFPYREDGVRAATESIRWIKGLYGLLDKIGRDRIGQVIASGDAMEASAMIREALLG